MIADGCRRRSQVLSSGGNLSFDPERGFALEQHAIYTRAPLVEEATTLTFCVDQTGRVTEEVRMEIGS